MRIFNVNGVKRLGSLKGGHKQLQKTSKAPCCYRSSPCNTMNLRSSESSPQIAPLDETIKEMCSGVDLAWPGPHVSRLPLSDIVFSSHDLLLVLPGPHTGARASVVLVGKPIVTSRGVSIPPTYKPWVTSLRKSGKSTLPSTPLLQMFSLHALFDLSTLISWNVQGVNKIFIRDQCLVYNPRWSKS